MTPTSSEDPTADNHIDRGGLWCRVADSRISRIARIRDPAQEVRHESKITLRKVRSDYIDSLDVDVEDDDDE